jgi:polysaccharide export outer membrane protein
MKIGKNLIKQLMPLFLPVFLLVLSGCATHPGWMSSSGASREQVQQGHTSEKIEGIQLVDVDNELAKKLAAVKVLDQFTDVYPSKEISDYIVNPGDIIEISVWEAQPAMLFGAVVLDPSAGATTTRVVTFPEQMVTQDGTITMPFAGYIQVRGRTTQQIEADIVKRLTGKANLPQVLVRIVQNNTANVTVVGDIHQSVRMPLTPKGERLLDALAASGGVNQPIHRMAVQLSRDNLTATMPLDTVIRDPRQNVVLKPGDVITALFQPLSFSVLGATGKNEEIFFEAQGISLAQALARSGGLIDNRADARGLFVFRFEDASLVTSGSAIEDAIRGTVPVVYQVDLRDPASFFITQNFPVQNRDVIYVANSPAAEFEKFMRLLMITLNPAVTANRTLLLP